MVDEQSCPIKDHGSREQAHPARHLAEALKSAANGERNMCLEERCESLAVSLPESAESESGAGNGDHHFSLVFASCSPGDSAMM